ncbi:hypothetical protein [Algoriphagus aquimarinus]|uniref:Glycosyltransferase RgtA/B/C/D-like domain-containing protein n=1 Tax=Algoriphagus aquimarinus TaxID=237018 RepID=A0A5C7AM09_9BACT|nr:hypothetical protein [Algoriphagus aquimarinus]TXE08789.1 hypothetical protein ESV85_14595 [Algoriphagus aquimarinus]
MAKLPAPNQALKYLVFFYAALSIVYWLFILAPGIGDEGLMSLYLSEGNKEGYYWLIQKGNFSLPYSLLVYPLSFIFPSYFALRIVSLAGVIFLYFYLNRRLNFKSQNFKNHILFYLFSGSFLLGTNDNLLFCLLTVFFTEVYLVLVKRQERIPLYALVCMITSLFTRQMVIIYSPIILAGLILVFHQKSIFRKEYLATLSTILVWFVLNIPSIQANGFISFDNKDTNQQMGMTWAQRQYLSQINFNAGKLPEFTHVSWEETFDYVQENGEASLPKTNVESILFDPLLTLQEFIKDFAYMIYSGFRQCGLGVFFPILGVWGFLKFGSRELGYLGGAQLFTMLVISLMIISYIEIRWLAPVFIMGIIGIENVNRSGKASNLLDVSNQLILFVLGLYGSWRYINLILEKQPFLSLV